MIELENLNDRPLEDILDEAKKQILYLTTDWTNFQESDPGITLVELFAWLKSIQHEYLARESPGVMHKFLKLLDIDIRRNKGSEALLEVSDITEDVNVPVRTRWKSGSMTFENISNQVLVKSKILSVDFDNSEFSFEEEYYKIDGSKVYYLFGKDIDRKNNKNEMRRFVINFDNKLPVNEIFNMYFSVYISHGLERNPVKPGDEFESMAKVQWEYYGEEDGVKGWHKIDIASDDTYNFLFSGIIKMRLLGRALPIKGEYKIRANLLYNEYDYPPRINNILTNVFRVCQNDTQCENVKIKKVEISKCGTIKLSRNIALLGENDIYLKKGDGWVKAPPVEIEKDLKSGQVKIKLSEYKDYLANLGDNDDAVLVVSCNNEIKNKVTLGSGSGMSTQIIEMNLNNVLRDDFEIMISENKDGEEVFYIWEKVDDFFSSDKYDRHYVFNKERNVLIFGDHIHGMAPRVGENNIQLCGLRYTFGDDSNTKEGMINRSASENEILKNARIEQITPAKGGEDEEPLIHAQSRAANLFRDPGRAVTTEDYENIVRRTPGLLFTNVRVLPNYMEGEDATKQNCVTIAVRWNRKVGLTLSKSYEKNIMNQINKYRLVNTKIKVVAPVYVGLIISGDVVTDSSYRKEQGLIEDEIKKYIKYEVNQELGRPLRFGDLFGMIDRMKYVARLEKLRIVPTGSSISRNVSEDVIVPPNGVYYVESIDFNYTSSSEIYSG